MAVSKKITISSGVANAPYAEFTVTETATSVSLNNSTISYSLILKRPYEIIMQQYATRYSSIEISWGSGSNETITASANKNLNGQGDLTLISGTATIPHDDNGARTLNLSATIELTITWGGVPLTTYSNSGTMALTTIDRYPSCVSSLQSRTETSLTVKWTSDQVCKKVWYRYKKTSASTYSSWLPSGGQDVNASSGTVSITGLDAASTYSVEVSVRSKASSLDGYSAVTNWTTYSYPYCNSAPSFNIGSEFSIGLYNPLGRSVTVTMIADDNTEKSVASAQTGTKVTGFYSDAWKDFWYKSIKNSATGTYSVKIQYGNVQKTGVGSTYKALSSLCAPTVGTISYIDTNDTTVAITGDSSKIVQNRSTVRYTVSNPTAKNYASISSVKVNVLGTTYSLQKSGTNYIGGNAVINSATDVSVTVTVEDSRGFKKSATKTVKMLAYKSPTGSLQLQRQFNFYSETNIRVSATYSSLNGGNTVAIKYRYKETSAQNYGSYYNLVNNVTSTFTVDNQSVWDVQVLITDTIGGSYTINTTLPKGIPIEFWDAKRTAVGINCFPQSDNSLWVNGYEVDPSKNINWGSVDQFVKLTPTETFETGFNHCQGMACDGTNIYLTNRNSYDDTVTMNIAVFGIGSLVGTNHVMTTGHYNSLYWYENKLYATAASLNNDNDPDYTKLRVINSDFTSSLVDVPTCWGFGVRKFDGKGYISALYKASARKMWFYDSYIQDSSNKQTPLAEITFDYTGCTTVQGTFHLTDNYIWLLETAYSDNTRASGHQVVRCFSYSGMMVKAFYIDSITDELQDLWVSNDNRTMYINDRNGRIYTFEIPYLYHTLTSSIAYSYALKSGTVKHVYKHPSNLDTGGTFTNGNNTYSVTSKFFLSDYTFLTEIGEVFSPTLWVNNLPCKGHVAENLGAIYFEGSFYWAGGSEIQWSMRFSRGADTYNYYYYLSRLTIRGRDPNTTPDPTRVSYDILSTNGSLSSGDLKNAFTYLYENGWFITDIYVDSMSYIVGIPDSSSDLGVI